MQKWRKYQFQSKKNLRVKISVISLFTVLLILPSQVFAEQFVDTEDISMIANFSVEKRKALVETITEIPIEDQKMAYFIGKNLDVKVRHIIQSGGWGNNDPRIIQVLPGVHTNLDVRDEDGDYYPYLWEEETFEESQYVILQSKLRGYDLWVEYDLKDFLEFDGKIYSKEIQMPIDVEIFLDEEIEVVYLNSRPVEVTGASGVNCIGCFINLEFLNDEKPVVKNIQLDGKEVDLKIWSNHNVGEVEFNSALYGTEIFFTIENEDQIVTLEIPVELSLYPFEVYLTEEGDDILDQEDKIRNTEFSYSEESVKLSIRPMTAGNISIIGSTQDVHEKVIENMRQKQLEMEKEKLEVEEKLDSEIKTTQEQLVSESQEVDISTVYENWGDQPNSGEGNSIIYIIIALVIAIIIGVIVKIKKN
tara:strand:+ start:171 stop:1424 length:1254 start_codon:yes stop_codon:yes gene_type:complete